MQETFRRQRARQLEERLALGQEWEENDLVFANEVGRPLEAGYVLRRSYWPLLAKAGLPRMHFHDLWHTSATLLLGRGIDPKVVSEMLGHASVSITLDIYSHVLPDMQEDDAAAMAIALGW